MRPVLSTSAWLPTLLALTAVARGDAAPTDSMSLGQAAVLGLIEGLTEYLPVSSTGHLLVAQRLMGIPSSDAANAYAICIQSGAILAVLLLYWRRVWQMLRGLCGRDAAGLRLAGRLLAAMAPLLVIVFFEARIKRHLFGPWPIVAAWFVGGVAILAVSHVRRARGRPPLAGLALDELTARLAFAIGAAQCIAVWPGVSRSLVTIVAGVVAGLSLPAAVEFSFLLGVLTLGAATLKDGLQYGEALRAAYPPGTMLLGVAVAFVSAAVAVRWMVAWLHRHGLEIFGYYRIAIAIVVAALLRAGLL